MNKLDNLKIGNLIAIKGIYAGHEEYDAIKGMVSEMSPDGMILVSTESLGDVQLEKSRIDPEHLWVVQYINDDFDRAFLSGRNIFEVKLNERIKTLDKPAKRVARSLRAIPHTSFRTKLDNELIPPKPIDYARNPR
jgi:hypothetical protein